MQVACFQLCPCGCGPSWLHLDLELRQHEGKEKWSYCQLTSFVAVPRFSLRAVLIQPLSFLITFPLSLRAGWYHDKDHNRKKLHWFVFPINNTVPVSACVSTRGCSLLPSLFYSACFLDITLTLSGMFRGEVGILECLRCSFRVLEII